MATVRIYNLTSENTSPQAGQYLAIDGSSTTQKINYSNLKKGIIGDTAMNTTATTVTGAIAEHSATLASYGTDIEDLNYMANAMFLLRNYSTTYSTGGGNVNIAAQDFNVNTPSGYSPLAITKIATGNTNIVVRSFNAQATDASYIVNLWSDNISASGVTCQITILYVRTGSIGS